MKIGLTQLMQSTPKIVQRVRAVVIYTLGGSLVSTEFLASKIGISNLDYSQWVGIIILATKGVSMLFGVGEDEAVKNAVESIKEVKEVSNGSTN